MKTERRTVFAGRLITDSGRAITVLEDRPYDLLCQLERKARALDAEGEGFRIVTWKYNQMVEVEEDA